jgi:hypothetical protein
MSYANFKPTIWSKAIQTALHEKTILADFCNRQFEGDAKLGGKVKILGAAAPSIVDYDPSVGLSEPETQEGSEVLLTIDQAKAFNFMIDDIDASQINGVKLLPILCGEAAAKMASVVDKHIAKIAATFEGVEKSASLALGTANKVKAAIDDAILHLREKNVDPSVETCIELPWWMYQIFKNELTDAKTSNDTLISNGVVGFYDGFKVKASNCLYNDGTDDHAIVRTRKAVAFANTIDETEAYRPEKFFSDAIKGLCVFGATVCRKDEIYIIKGHKG